MDLGAPASGWRGSGLRLLLGCFQCLWTLGTKLGGEAVCLLGLQNTALQPDPKPGPKKSLCAKSLRGGTQRSGPSWDTKLSGHRDGGPGLRFQHQASLCLFCLSSSWLAGCS